ncbi:sulfatase [Rapidithrix thailandica]|uniref:Sulfatase n=1 Tax=Rapidithrix thailandica TaxID=413964 RepID=A0AAW9S3X6_9BACT
MKTTTLYLLILAILTFSCKTERKEEDKQPTSKQPNIIMFLVDDMGWQDTSVPFYKESTPFNQQFQTPNMEKLAAEGMKFTQAYACAVCSPTRVSLNTGMNAAHHKVTNWTLRKDNAQEPQSKFLTAPNWNHAGMAADSTVENAVFATPLAEILKQAGYRTIHVGKAHLGAINTPGENPLNLGFEVNIAGHAAGAPASYLGTKSFSKPGKDRTWNVPGLEKYHGKDIFLSEALTLEAVEALDAAVDAQKPFYLYMSHYAVHTPIEADERFAQKYRDAGLEEVEARYASMVEGMDKSLGDLMRYLEKKGIAENTIILFMSDNGGLSAVARGGEPHTHNLPLSSGKGSAHEGGIREPMLVKWPGVVAPDSHCDQYLIIEDFYPTILEMAGVKNYETVQAIDGQSFIPLLIQEEGYTTEERPLFWHYPNHWGPAGPGLGASSTARLGDWKLIYYHTDQRFELFNLREDIGETENLVDKHPEKLKELAGVLTDYLKSVDAQMPVDKATGKTVVYPEEALAKNDV